MPWAEAHRAPLSSDAAKTLRIARYSLWTLRRSRTWLDALDTYQRFDPRVRAYDVPDAETPAARRDLSVAGDRFSVYGEYVLPVAGTKSAGSTSSAS
ncbi:hypothetical protein AB0958_17945 [Streptomyces sp. NPDC006655]|uniref:pPIWI_RE_Z domain-containing protein n=1 Tax=Streptomyces sp. NPDC006655 TaxID=3156898 RepID=UPI003453AD6C